MKIASTSPLVKSILDSALTAGKAARDPEQVPALGPLKKFGSGGSRYSTDPPAALTKAATEVGTVLGFTTHDVLCDFLSAT